MRKGQVRTMGRAAHRVLQSALILLIAVGSGSAFAQQPARSASSVPPKTEASPAPLLAYFLGALGLSGLSVGATTGFLAMDQRARAEDHCSPALRLCDAAGRAANDTGRTLRDISTAGFIVGGLGIGLSAYLLLTPTTRQSAVSVAVVVDGGSPNAALIARF